VTKVIVAVLAAFAAGTAGVTRAAFGPRAQRSPAVTLAEQLTHEPDALPGFATAIPSDRAWAEAQRRATRIPLPVGGNFNGVRWTTRPTLTPAQIEQILEYNAMCQWLRARRDQRDRDRAEQVLATVPSWPTMRAHGQSVAIAVGDATAAMARGILADCERSHVREVAYARAARLAPQR
jgi:hypothetical protein